MSMQARKWRPLQVAIAWVVTRDEQFCDAIANDGSALQRTFCGSALLEHEMMEAGCFNVSDGILKFEPPAPNLAILRHSIKPNYRGRFRVLAERYGDGRQHAINSGPDLPNSPVADGVSVGDFLLGRWHDAFRLIADRIADGEIAARGVAIDGERRQPAGDLPAASVNLGMWMDLDGLVWEGPQVLYAEQPRRWGDVAINWNDLVRCFEPHPAIDCSLVEWTFVRDPKHVARDKIIDALQAGRIGTDQANEEAARLGLEPFETTADPELYDPRKEANWSLPMTLTWIIWRDLSRVRQYWDAARNVTIGWSSASGIARLETLGLASIGRIYVDSDLDFFGTQAGADRKVRTGGGGGSFMFGGDGFGGDPASNNPAEVAFRQIRELAATGKLLATGVPVSGGPRLPISEHVWHDIHMADFPRAQHLPKIPTIARAGEWEAGWTEILFPSNKVQKLWRAPKTKQTVSAQAACRAWLVTEMKESANQRPKTKDAFYREACIKFPGIGSPDNLWPSRAFDWAWAEAIAETGAAWDGAGAPKKSPR